MKENKLTNAQVYAQLTDTMTSGEKEALRVAVKVYDDNTFDTEKSVSLERRRVLSHGMFDCYQFMTEENTKAGFRQLIKKYQNAERVKVSQDELDALNSFYTLIME